MPRVTSATAEFDLRGTPRVRIDVEGNDVAGISIIRTNPDLTVYPVRQAENFATDSTRALTVYDYEMPTNRRVSYAFSSRNTGPARLATATLPPKVDGFFVSPGDPGASVPIKFIGELGSDSGATGTVLQRVMNKKRAVPVTNVVSQGITSSIVVRTDTLEEAARMRNLLENTAVLLICIPAFSGVDDIWRYAVRTGDWSMGFPDNGITEQRSWSFPYAEVDRPVGNLLPMWNVAKVLEENASIGSLRTKYKTVADLRNNVQQVRI